MTLQCYKSDWHENLKTSVTLTSVTLTSASTCSINTVGNTCKWYDCMASLWQNKLGRKRACQMTGNLRGNIILISFKQVL